ncbi:Gfo/Idh/MocA family oxidoreductase [Breoghania sp. L-A4]|uniref:Gfo/Idh/MocA family protein n=1 Tax=Breoghania sp. L-A4 TaxID=2304600 RepID=UPI0013C33C28|nr:Gfo/Idh/MocA family oxidoreductase [Breoghania sp. L-A4]
MTADPADVSIGLVGFGRWGKNIFRDLRCLGVAVHVAVPGPLSQKAALEAGALSAVGDVRDLTGMDGYVVACSTHMHAHVLEILANRQRPIFVEKPMTDNPAAARRLVDMAGDRIFVMDKWRYHPGVVALAQHAKSGALGEILAIRTYRLGWGNPHNDVDAVWILLPHDLSIVLEIMGDIPAARKADALIPGRPGDGIIATLQDGPGDVLVTSEVSACQPASRRSVTVIGTLGTAQLADSYDDCLLTVAAAPGQMATPQRLPVGTEMPLLLELSAFLSHLKGGPAPRSSAAEGLMIVERIHELRQMAGLR